ncbi:hypothetical protein V6N13_140552 [Hibiscus sabdariffa]
MQEAFHYTEDRNSYKFTDEDVGTELGSHLNYRVWVENLCYSFENSIENSFSSWQGRNRTSFCHGQCTANVRKPEGVPQSILILHD